MSAGYADTLMACRTVWAFPGIVVLGIAASIWIANLTAKLFKLKKKYGNVKANMHHRCFRSIEQAVRRNLLTASFFRRFLDYMTAENAVTGAKGTRPDAAAGQTFYKCNFSNNCDNSLTVEIVRANIVRSN